MSEKRAQRSYYEINFAFQTGFPEETIRSKSGVRLWLIFKRCYGATAQFFRKCFRWASISSVI
jgi:hypothetical protein